MNTFAKFIFCIVLVVFYSKNIAGKNTWTIDKKLSEIKFEVPVLLAKKIKGQFKDFDSLIVVDLDNKVNNKALFSVQINSMEINYAKYKELLFSNVFFDEKKFPIATIDSKKFTLPTNSNSFLINVELQIKDIVHVIPLTVKLNYLANNFVQVTTNFKFSRNSYKLGKDKWSSNLILRDTIHVKVNLFLNRN